MRIAIGAWNLRRISGIESYLATIIPELERAHCEVSLLGEVDVPAGRLRIAPPEVPTWCIADIGRLDAIRALRQWAPDVIFMNGAPELATQREALKIAPAIFYAHGYYGTCISGAKVHKFPRIRPCHRRFGSMCLLHYWPHRCGGLSPKTMFKMYRQTKSQALLMQRYQSIVGVSEAIRQEYIGHKFVEPSRVITLQYPFRPPPSTPAVRPAQQKDPTLLLFLGRMTEIKGGQLLINAMSEVTRRLDRPIKLIFAGDGPQRKNWERQARRVVAANNAAEIEFVGWLEQPMVDAMFSRADLLVVPSLWPEPSALVGREAGLHGVPQVAFAVGGNPEWLIDGSNGYVAPGESPTSAGLVEAIVKCVRDPVEHARLRCGAIEVASRFTMSRHLESLLGVLEDAASRGPAA